MGSKESPEVKVSTRVCIRVKYRSVMVFKSIIKLFLSIEYFKFLGEQRALDQNLNILLYIITTFCLNPENKICTKRNNVKNLSFALSTNHFLLFGAFLIKIFKFNLKCFENEWTSSILFYYIFIQLFQFLINRKR